MKESIEFSAGIAMIARMQKNTRILYGSLAVIAVIVIGGLLLYFGPAARAARADDAARAVMMEFGTKLQNVSLLADDGAVTAAIEENYGSYVTPELLADWKVNHSHAPGRLSSSTWPDRFGITFVTAQGNSRVISGEVILISNAESADESAETVPFVAQLIQTDGGWRIAAYQEETVQTLKKIPTTDEDIPGAR